MGVRGVREKFCVRYGRSFFLMEERGGRGEGAIRLPPDRTGDNAHSRQLRFGLFLTFENWETRPIVNLV